MKNMILHDLILCGPIPNTTSQRNCLQNFQNFTPNYLLNTPPLLFEFSGVLSVKNKSLFDMRSLGSYPQTLPNGQKINTWAAVSTAMLLSSPRKLSYLTGNDLTKIGRSKGPLGNELKWRRNLES